MTRAELILDLAIVLRPLIGVVDNQGDRGARRQVLKRSR